MDKENISENLSNFEEKKISDKGTLFLSRLIGNSARKPKSKILRPREPIYSGNIESGSKAITPKSESALNDAKTPLDDDNNDWKIVPSTKKVSFSPFIKASSPQYIDETGDENSSVFHDVLTPIYQCASQEDTTPILSSGSPLSRNAFKSIVAYLPSPSLKLDLNEIHSDVDCSVKEELFTELPSQTDANKNEETVPFSPENEVLTQSESEVQIENDGDIKQEAIKIEEIKIIDDTCKDSPKFSFWNIIFGAMFVLLLFSSNETSIQSENPIVYDLNIVNINTQPEAFALTKVIAPFQMIEQNTESENESVDTFENCSAIVADEVKVEPEGILQNIETVTPTVVEEINRPVLLASSINSSAVIGINIRKMNTMGVFESVKIPGIQLKNQKFGCLLIVKIANGTKDPNNHFTVIDIFEKEVVSKPEFELYKDTVKGTSNATEIAVETKDTDKSISTALTQVTTLPIDEEELLENNGEVDWLTLLYNQLFGASTTTPQGEETSFDLVVLNTDSSTENISSDVYMYLAVALMLFCTIFYCFYPPKANKSEQSSEILCSSTASVENEYLNNEKLDNIPSSPLHVGFQEPIERNDDPEFSPICNSALEALHPTTIMKSGISYDVMSKPTDATLLLTVSKPQNVVKFAGKKERVRKIEFEEEVENGTVSNTLSTRINTRVQKNKETIRPTGVSTRSKRL